MQVLTCYLKSHKDKVISISLTNDEKFVISGSFDTKIIIWSIESYRVYKFWHHSKGIVEILKLGDGFISLSSDDSIGYFNVSSRSFQISSYLKKIYSNSKVFANKKNIIGYGRGNQAVVWNKDLEKEEYIY